MQLDSTKTLLSSSPVTFFNIDCIDLTCPVDAGMPDTRTNSIVALLTCSVRNITCIAIKTHKQIGYSLSSVVDKQNLIDNSIKYFLSYNKQL